MYITNTSSAFALIKQMLQLENRSKDACDLWIASLSCDLCQKNRSLSTPSPI